MLRFGSTQIMPPLCLSWKMRLQNYTLLHTYKTCIRPIIDYYRAVILCQAKKKPNGLTPVPWAPHNPILLELKIYTLANLPQFTTRLEQLRSSYIARTIQSHNDTAKSTLLTRTRPLTKKKLKTSIFYPQLSSFLLPLFFLKNTPLQTKTLTNRSNP